MLSVKVIGHWADTTCVTAFMLVRRSVLLRVVNGSLQSGACCKIRVIQPVFALAAATKFGVRRRVYHTGPTLLCSKGTLRLSASPTAPCPALPRVHTFGPKILMRPHWLILIASDACSRARRSLSMIQEIDGQP